MEKIIGVCSFIFNFFIILNRVLSFLVIRNSWGEDVGEKGYYKMARNKDMCGISQHVYYPIVLESDFD
jgi:aminopeptidase C